MRDMNVLFGRVAIVATALFALSASAGIKYWDNPAFRAFDVNCYVPGAVWNLDGIRNQGVGKEHSATALTWVNCGSSTTNDVFLQKHTGSGWATASADELSAGTYGEWTANGFVFKGNSRMRANSPKRIDTGTKYTIQFLIDASTSDQTKANAAVFNSSWDKFSFIVLRDSNQLVWKTPMSKDASNNHGFISGTSFDYATAIANGDNGTTAFFSGTEAPTSGDGFRQYSSISGQSEAGYGFGATSDNTYLFKGTLKSFRYYQRVLTADELAWNRVVDERRFFDRAAPLPVTNVVVATAVAGLEGTEPSGCYDVDENGYTFTAPRTTTLAGTKYLCTGYTIEEWDDTTGDWGTATFHARELSCAATASSRVRLTWQWTAADGLVTYDISDYVWDGLVLFYDGICNAGTDAPHDPNATTWKNLGSAKAPNDMFLQLLNAGGTEWTTASSLDAVDGRNPGAWTADGFALKGDSRWRVVNTGGTNGGIDTGTDYTLQTLLDVNAADQLDSSAFVFSLSATKYSLLVYKSGSLKWRNDNDGDGVGGKNPSSINGTSFDYATAIMNGETKSSALFAGTEIPDSGDGFRQYESITAHNLERGYDLGGYGNANYDKLLVGTIKSFRQYDHALSPEEVAQNRKVDDFRFFGKFDVIVQSTHPALRGNEPDGEYGVNGSHTFTAPETATIKVNGKEIEYACAGYTVEIQDGLTWTVAQRGDGNSVAITEGAVQRLTWLWKPVRGIRTAADYSFDDYSQAGLVWNYDGLYNAGVGVHDSEATTWKNLGSGANADLHWNGKTTTGHWIDDGYVFAGGPRFKGDASFYLRNFTLQTLVDADASAQTAGSTYGSIFCGMYQYFNLYLITESYDGSAAGSLCWRAQADGKYMYFKTPGHHYDYATAIQDFENATAKIFPGVDIPDTPAENDYNAQGEKQRTCYQFATMKSGNDTGYGLGQRGNETTWGMVGTLKNFRYYDRVLTEEEIVRNRNADAVRYFGALGVTNVLVQTKYGDVESDAQEVLAEAPGAYTVEGTWTFSATRVKDRLGALKDVAGYYTEELDALGNWTNKTWHEGKKAYKYDSATSPACVRLTWSVMPPGLILILR